MISSLSFWFFVFTASAATFSGFLWQDKHTTQYYGRYISFFFGGKIRSLVTAHSILLFGFTIVVVASPQIEIPELFGVLCGAEAVLLGIGLGGFMNWRIGRWAFAPRHGIVAKRIGNIQEKDELDDALLEVQLRSMIAEIRNGNSASRKHLMSLTSRNDEIGRHVREMINSIDASFSNHYA